MVKIKLKREECIGCGACAAIDPTNWEMQGDKTTLKDSQENAGVFEKEVAEVGSAKDAANACPVQCIIVEE
jgi:ferredoxin